MFVLILDLMLEQIVTSKYFQKSGMDESFSDFQEKKKIFTGPKSKKPSVKKQISKKRIKGQKDIRSLIRPKKNELLTFTKNFNEVCTRSGIDVDSQELQLAIALSKSLQQSDQTESGEVTTNKLTSQERTNRIRRTLQEYGFKIPQANIKLEGCKRVKKYRKAYKLLQISEEERLQNISNRYSQVLFENPDKSFEKGTNNYNNDSKLYQLATNITYEHIRSNKVYVTEILQDISITNSNLLKDWSDIPGRPVSPKLIEEYVISMPDIQCSQSELDIILSGTLNTAKDILKSKLNSYLDTEDQVNNIPDNNITITCVENIKLINNKVLEFGSGQENLSTMLYEHNRSNSPDIFDDDPSLIDHQNVNEEHTKTGISNSKLDIPAELTSKIDNSQSSNITKRKSNDFMDLTECVPITSQCRAKLLDTLNEVELPHDSMEVTKCINPISQESEKRKGETKHSLRSVSLEDEHSTPDAPVPEEDKDLDFSLDDTIILKDYVDLTQNYGPKELVEDLKDNIETMDLTQSSNSSYDELPAVIIPGVERETLSPDDTIVQDYATIIQTNFNKPPLNSKKLHHNVIEINENIVLDISDVLPDINPKGQSRSIHNSQHGTTIEDFTVNQSGSENTSTCVNKENDNIDLTQSSDSNIDGYQEGSTGNVSENLQFNNHDSLGKKGDISIDYDEIVFDRVENDCTVDDKSLDIQSKSSNSSQPHNSSRNSKNDFGADNISDNFEICDRELNYSMYRSRVDVDFEGISIVDNIEIANINKSKNRICFNNYTINRSLSESDLIVNNNKANYRDKQFNITLSKSACSTPIKATVTDDRVEIKTPTNSEYIIKLGKVTPMLDYEAMSSPERNKELEKYGLKPFKRKRAIQLLTHLYNQTHPIIEQCSEDPVPNKKLKPNSAENSISKENNIFDKENIYIETTTIPNIRNIECCPDDWVFQKKEKAKVHSCPIPLHIAFHNYVSCRRYLRETILRYEPINIDAIHKDLVSYGYKYNPKDLLRFLDRKCITVKTADNNVRNNKK